MGLNIVVGAADDPEEAAEGETFLSDMVAEANKHLKVVGLPGWDEPAGGEEIEFGSFGYSALHTLRRIAVHVRNHGTLPSPMAAGAASRDPELNVAYATGPSLRVTVRKRFGRLVGKAAGKAAPSAFDHLIHHSDAEGLYAPVDFAPVILSETLWGSHLGSSPRPSRRVPHDRGPARTRPEHGS